jgi:hypothetical protein
MTKLENGPPPVVGAYWINEEDYPALQKLFDDGHRMPRTWKDWLKIAEEMEQGLKAYGHVVMRVTSIRRHFRIGVLLMARARAVKDAKGSLLRPSVRGTAIKVDNCAFENSNGHVTLKLRCPLNRGEFNRSTQHPFPLIWHVGTVCI